MAKFSDTAEVSDKFLEALGKVSEQLKHLAGLNMDSGIVQNLVVFLLGITEQSMGD